MFTTPVTPLQEGFAVLKYSYFILLLNWHKETRVVWHLISLPVKPETHFFISSS